MIWLSRRDGSGGLGSLCEQSLALFVIYGLQGDKFFGQYIHSAQDGQLEEKLHHIQVAEDQGAGIAHLVADAIEMRRHLGPVQAGTVVMAQVVAFVHEVQLVEERHGVCKIIFGMFRIAEGVLHPGGERHDEVHAEQGNQHVHDSNSPIVNKDSGEEEVVSRHAPQNSAAVFFVTFGFEVSVGSQAQGGPNVVGKIPQEIQRAGAIVAAGGDGVVGAAVFAMVQADVNGAIQFRNVAVQISEEEFDVAAENSIVFLGEVALAAVGFQVFGAEHPHEALELETVERKIESDGEQEPRFA